MEAMNPLRRTRVRTVWAATGAFVLGHATATLMWMPAIVSLGLFGAGADRGAAPLIHQGWSMLWLIPMVVLPTLLADVRRLTVAAWGVGGFALAAGWNLAFVNASQLNWWALGAQLAVVTSTVLLASASRVWWESDRRVAAVLAVGGAGAMSVAFSYVNGASMLEALVLLAFAAAIVVALVVVGARGRADVQATDSPGVVVGE